MSTRFSRTLFVTRQGEALQFYIRPCSEKIKLRPLIEERGGLLANRPDKNVYRLVLPGDRLPEGSSSSLKVQFIYDCISSNQLVPLDQYQVHKKSDAEIEDELDIDNLEDDDSAFCINTVMRNTRSRKEYCYEDDKNIINFILKNHSYAEVKGRAMWIKMEKISGSRTWQSLKERYLKRIIPNLSEFRLPDKDYALLKKGAGAWTRQDRAMLEQRKARKRIVVHEDSTDSDATIKFNPEVEKVMEQDPTPGKENVSQSSPNRPMENLNSSPRNTRSSKVVDKGTNISSDKGNNISRSGATEKSGSSLQASSSVVTKDKTAVKGVVSSPSPSKNTSVQPKEVSVNTRRELDSKKAPEEQANHPVDQRKTSPKSKSPFLVVKKVTVEKERVQNLPSTPTSRNLEKPVASVSPINENRAANRDVTNITFSNDNSLLSPFASKPTRLVRATPVMAQSERQGGNELQPSCTSNQSSELETQMTNVSPSAKPEACSSPVLCRSRTEKLQLHKLRKTLSDKLCVSVSNCEDEEKLQLSSATESSQFSSQETNRQSQLEYLDCTEEFRISVLDCLEKWRISLGDKLHTNESAGKSQTPVSSQELEGCQNMDCSVSLLDENGAGLHLEHLRKSLEEKMRIQSSTAHSSYQSCCSNNTVSDADSYDSVDELILGQAPSPDQAIMLEKLQAKMKKKIMQGNAQVKGSKNQSSEETLVDSQEIPTALPLLDSLPLCTDEVTFVSSSTTRDKLTPLKTSQSGRSFHTTSQSHKRQLTPDGNSKPPNKIIRQGSSLDASDRENRPVGATRTPPLASNSCNHSSLDGDSSRMTLLINETGQALQFVDNCVQSWRAKSRKGHGLVAMNDGDLLITKSELETFFPMWEAVKKAHNAVVAEGRTIHIMKKLVSAVTEKDTLELGNYLSNFQK